MEFLKKLGLTDEQINEVTNAETTAERIEEIATALKGRIESVAINNPDRHAEIISKTKLETTKIIEKAVAKALGVKKETEDDLQAILEKGKALLTENNSDTLKAMQNELIDLKAKYTKLETEEMPNRINETKSIYQQKHIDSAISSTLKDLKDIIIDPNDRISILKPLLASMGLVTKYNEEQDRIEIVNKVGNLKPIINDKDYEPTDLNGIFDEIFSKYRVKNNAGAQGGGNGGAAAAAQPAGQLNPVTQALLDGYK